MTRRRNSHTVDRVRVTDDGEHRPAGRRYYASEAGAIAGLRRWTARTEADHNSPNRPVRYRFFLYRLEAFFRSRDLETWHDGTQANPSDCRPHCGPNGIRSS